MVLVTDAIVVYIDPSPRQAIRAYQGGEIVRTIGLVVLMLAVGCSTPPSGGLGASDGIPPEAVRAYAKAHGLTRDEARRELELYRDADYLEDLRQAQTKAADESSSQASTGAVAVQK